MAKAIATVFRDEGENIAPSMPGGNGGKKVGRAVIRVGSVPGIEDVLDIIARALIDEGYSKEAKA